jgi:hypothetical protein
MFPSMTEGKGTTCDSDAWTSTGSSEEDSVSTSSLMDGEMLESALGRVSTVFVLMVDGDTSSG